MYRYERCSGPTECDEQARVMWGIGPDEHVTYERFLEGHPADLAGRVQRWTKR
jgi:hypothetical protein